MLIAHHRLTAVMDDHLRARHGLRLDWYDVLYQLNRAGGRLRMHELADATLFSRTDCTRLVDRMARAGLVRREPAAEDGRGVYASVTGAGKAVLRQAAETHLDDIQRLFAVQLTPEEAAAMASGLGKVLGNGGMP
jgi:DNA-binding MarR family transcriptional regulator